LIFRHDPIPITWDRPKLVEGYGEGHYYQVPGIATVFPSITTILSAKSSRGLDRWRQRLGDKAADTIKNSSASRGKSLHAISEKYLITGDAKQALTGVMPDQIIQFKAWQPVLDRINDIRGIELPVYSEQLGIAGTMDVAGSFDGDEAIIDFKNARKPKLPEYVESHFIQATAYQRMLHERSGWNPKKLVILVAVFDHEPQVFVEDISKRHVINLVKAIEHWKGKSPKMCLFLPNR